MPEALRGVYAPLATLVDPWGRVLPADMGHQIDAIRSWVSGLMPAIGCGEGIHLNDEQWTAVLLATLNARGDLPVFMGVQAPVWQVSRQRAVAAAKHGVDGVVVGIPPGERGASIDQVLHACEQLARQCPIGVVFYWESFISSSQLSGEDAARICVALGARSVKDSMRNPLASAALREHLPGVTLLEGWEDRLLADQPLDGYVGPLALLTDAPATLFTDKPDWARCLSEAHQYRVLEPDYVSYVKWELYARGIASYPDLVPRRLGAMPSLARPGTARPRATTSSRISATCRAPPSPASSARADQLSDRAALMIASSMACCNRGRISAGS